MSALRALRAPDTFLPADHPTVGFLERSQQIGDRLQGFNRRKNPANFEAFRDSDGDGEHNSGDLCAGTAEGEVVDGDGCSREQFCEGIDTSTCSCDRVIPVICAT